MEDGPLRRAMEDVVHTLDLGKSVGLKDVISYRTWDYLRVQIARSKSEVFFCHRNDYLEQKKKSFPRFYFVANGALLDILSNGNKPLKAPGTSRAGTHG